MTANSRGTPCYEQLDWCERRIAELEDKLADYEQKMIEAVEQAFQSVPWGWDGDCDAENIVIEAIKQVMKDEQP